MNANHKTGKERRILRDIDEGKEISAEDQYYINVRGYRKRVR